MTPHDRRPHRRSVVSPKVIGIILTLVVVAVALLGYWFFIRDNPTDNTITSQDLKAMLAQPLTTTQNNDVITQATSVDPCVHNLTYPGFSAAKEQLYDWTWVMLGLPREAVDGQDDPYVVAYMHDVYNTGIQKKFSDNPEEVISFTITYCIPP